MDPLSIAASVIAIATIATQVGEAFRKLRVVCAELPGRIHALSNEVNDLEVVLHQLSTVVQERHRLTDNDQSSISSLLSQARERLEEMRDVVERLITICGGRPTLLRASIWRKLHPKLQSLQEEIRTIKSSLNVLIGASNSRDMMRVRVELEALSAVTTRSSEDESAFRDQFSDSLAAHEANVIGSVGQRFDQVDYRIARVEDLLKEQVAQMEANYLKHMGIMYGLGRVHSRRRSLSPSSPSSETEIQQPRLNRNAVGVRVSKYAETACRPGCPCSCHSAKRRAMSGFLDKVIGQLFIGYAGLPYITEKCDTELCERRQALAVNAEYWFPMGFCWSQIVRIQLGYEPNLGPRMSLSTFRQVPDNSPSVAFALEGNIEGLKTLFGRGLASPRDVSSTRGYSLLRWALYGQKYDACKFLLEMGADQHYSPISPSDNCPSDKASDMLLRGGISSRVIEILRAIAEGSDFVEEQDFRQVHKVVLGLSFKNLEDAILEEPEDIDVPDAMGRTALEWAAARGDDRAVATLLSYGADPNLMDKKLNTPLTLAANQNHTICVRLLLEAGADPDPVLPTGVKFGTPLNCAARNASDPLLLKTLVDFNANVEATGVDGVTPLLHVARGKGARHAVILLECGANINATAKDGRTPLTTAIMYNNHDVLALLLDRWYEYSECPRLKGPHLLDLVVQYADVKTIQILSGASHLKLRGDNQYVLERFGKGIRERPGVTQDIVDAFDALLDVLRCQPSVPKSHENAFRSELAKLKGKGHEHSVDGIVDDDDSNEAFEDAQEKLDPALHELESLISDIKKCKTW